MGVRTSIYLSDDLAAMWRASGVKLGELVRRGLNAGGAVDESTLRRVVREIIRDELASLPVGAPGRPESRYVADEYEPEPYLQDP